MSEEKKARRQYTTEQKLALLDEADQPGQSVALVARKHGISPSVMFRWRQLREQGAISGLKADEPLVPASEMKAARTKIRNRCTERTWRAVREAGTMLGCAGSTR